jgi:hypothetical protein
MTTSPTIINSVLFYGGGLIDISKLTSCTYRPEDYDDQLSLQFENQPKHIIYAKDEEEASSIYKHIQSYIFNKECLIVNQTFTDSLAIVDKLPPHDHFKSARTNLINNYRRDVESIKKFASDKDISTDFDVFINLTEGLLNVKPDFPTPKTLFGN